MGALEAGRKSGEEQGWISSEQLRNWWGILIMNNQISYAPKAREDLLEIKTFIEEESR